MQSYTHTHTHTYIYIYIYKLTGPRVTYAYLCFRLFFVVLKKAPGGMLGGGGLSSGAGQSLAIGGLLGAGPGGGQSIASSAARRLA